MPKKQTHQGGMRSNWEFWNKQPVKIRVGTTPELKEQFNILQQMFKADNEMISRTREQAREKAEASEYWPYLKDGYFYSTMENTGFPTNVETIRKQFIFILQRATLEFTVNVITVFFEERWQSLKEVYTKL